MALASEGVMVPEVVVGWASSVAGSTVFPCGKSLFLVSAVLIIAIFVVEPLTESLCSARMAIPLRTAIFIPVFTR